MVLRKDQLEASLHEEKKLIETGRLKDDNPLDLSESFTKLCNACRRGDLKACQESITDGANINARDKYDYTPLILASLCGHYEVVQLLLESGALCERDTFQGERCLYNALNDRIRNLLLSYDYSKSTNPLQPFASHVTSLLSREHPKTSDIAVTSADRTFHLHKFVLSARSPYFGKKLGAAPDTTTWRIPPSIPSAAFEVAIRYVYLGEMPHDFSSASKVYSEEVVLEGLDRLSKHLETPTLWQEILDGDDRRLSRQNREEELKRGRQQVEFWCRENVLRHKVEIASSKADEVRWDRDNGIFADVLLRADEDHEEDERLGNGTSTPVANGITVGPLRLSQELLADSHRQRSVLYPVHKAMLLRSEYFSTMFSSPFLEAQDSPYLRILRVDCTPAVLEIVLTFIYAEQVAIPLELALDVLYTADQLLIESLKNKAAVAISTLGNGSMAQLPSARANGTTAKSEPPVNGTAADGVPIANGTSRTGGGDDDDDETASDPLDPYAILRAAWQLNVQRLEEFTARYFAYRLERYVDEPEFAELVQESASRVRAREETDTIELVDDVRWYLSERFRMRFEDVGLEEAIGNGAGAVAAPHDPVDADVADGSRAVGAKVNGHGGDAVVLPPTPDSGEDAGPREAVYTGAIRTLDGEEVDDEFAHDAHMYQMLMGKIDVLLDNLKLDA